MIKTTINAPSFRDQIWRKIFNREIDFIAVIKNEQGMDEAEIRQYGSRKVMVFSKEWFQNMLRDAVKKYHFSAFGTGNALAGIPFFNADNLNEFDRVKEISVKSHEVV